MSDFAGGPSRIIFNDGSVGPAISTSDFSSFNNSRQERSIIDATWSYDKEATLYLYRVMLRWSVFLRLALVQMFVLYL